MGNTFYTENPGLTLDNGIACTIANMGAFTSISDAICNNGREAFVGSTDTIRQGLFTGSDPAIDLLVNALVGNIHLNAEGDIAYDAYTTNFISGEDLNLLLLDTTHVVQ